MALGDSDTVSPSGYAVGSSVNTHVDTEAEDRRPAKDIIVDQEEPHAPLSDCQSRYIEVLSSKYANSSQTGRVWVENAPLMDQTHSLVFGKRLYNVDRYVSPASPLSFAVNSDGVCTYVSILSTILKRLPKIKWFRGYY